MFVFWVLLIYIAYPLSSPVPIVLDPYFLLFYFACLFVLVFADDLVAEKDKNRMLQADMEATLQDIQNM